MRTQIYALMSLLTVAMLASTTASHSFAADIVFLGEKGSPTQALDTIDHTTWSVLLARYVDSDGRVDYRRWKANANDMRLLDAYLIRLSSGDPQSDSTREARLAFWINAYNAVTVRGILREYPTTSIRNHTAKLWGYNIWKHLQLYVGGRAYSLDQIEHDVLRNMQEPRIHFAIVCASNGCPRLLDQAYTPSKLDEQLESNAKDFFSREANFQFDPTKQRFRLSAILDWFGEDFGADTKQRLIRISPWLADPTASAAAKANTVSVEFMDYDWSLNEQ